MRHPLYPVLPPAFDPVRGVAAAPGQAFFDPRRLPGLVFYHELQALDAAYETLPGSTLATAQNDGIGAVLDIKRYRERGAELIVNGDFNSADGWTLGSGWSIAGGKATRVAPGVGSSVTQPFDDVTGRLYEVTVNIDAYSGFVRIIMGGGTQVNGPLIQSVGETTFLMVGNGTNTFWGVACTSADTTITADSLIIREIPGYHALQDVAANQPVLNIENGIRSALFDGTDDRLVIPNSKGALSFLHNGQGGEIHVCCRIESLADNSALFANLNTLSGTETGVAFSVLTSGRLDAFIANGAGGFVDRYTGSSAVVVGTPAVFSVAASSAGVKIFANASLEHDGAFLSSPSVSDATTDAVIGSRHNGAWGLNGSMYSLAVTQGILTDYQRQRLVTYMLRRAGA